MTPDVEATPTAPPVQRPNILTVQGCAGCSRPARVKVQTPFGVRTLHNRLKMTRIPGVVSVEARHPRSSPVERTYPTYAKLCKGCRRTARAAA